MNTGQTAEEGIALPDFRSLLTERLCKAVKTLRRTHDNPAIFPILRNDFQHLRRKVLALVTAEPILHFINTGNLALDTVFIADQKPPIIQFFILATQGEVCDTPGFRVFLTPCKGLLSHCNGFTVPLHTVNGEKFTLETVRIEDSTHQALHPSYSAEKSGQRIKLDFPSIIIGGKAKRDSQFLTKLQRKQFAEVSALLHHIDGKRRTIRKEGHRKQAAILNVFEKE